MTTYLGICMVVVVTTLCIAILSTIVTENVFKQIEAHKKRVSDQRWMAFGKFLITFREKYKKELDEIIEKLEMKRTKDFMETVDEKTDEIKKKGIKIEDL